MDKPLMTPATGSRLLKFVGDRVRFSLRAAHGAFPGGSRPLLRTNLGKAATLRREIISSHAGKRPLSISFWRDIPLEPQADGSWTIDLPLTEVGYFNAKCYVVDPQGFQVWPDGPDLGLAVHPDRYRTGNTIYCAFPRMFGETRTAQETIDPAAEKKLKVLDAQGYTVIPPSGKLRDVIRQLPHIVNTLGCRIIHLLPVSPTPTTYARFGRFGSPYACEDLTAIDPALVEFDQRTTGVDQFCELAKATHRMGARVFLDIVINHTGWGSTLQENHPEWFLRKPNGDFESPGAWGTVWEDLVELEPNHTALWENLAEAFLTWCRRGVDGFRCDAGYKVPLPVWQYIVARVREEFPETIFLLEGLGGPWTATEALLTEGGMQWAYSELFQNYSGGQVSWYLDYAIQQSESVGVYVHYSETHDNDRLAKQGRTWSLLRNRLCALTSANGGFGFTCGVEWLAAEKINVHSCRGLSWGSEDNIIPELAALNRLLDTHPCFFDGARLLRLSSSDSPVCVLKRETPNGLDTVLVVVNTNIQFPHALTVEASSLGAGAKPLAPGDLVELLGQPLPKFTREGGKLVCQIEPGAAYCFALTPAPTGLSGEAYRQSRARAAFALTALSRQLRPEEIGPAPWHELAKRIDADAAGFLGSLGHLDRTLARVDLLKALTAARGNYPELVTWSSIDKRRITPVPPAHWLLVRDSRPFRASLVFQDGSAPQYSESIAVHEGYIACFAPRDGTAALATTLRLERLTGAFETIEGAILFLQADPDRNRQPEPLPAPESIALLTNGIGGMARICIDLGAVRSKYDCVLGANLNAEVPVDRHVFVKRIRAWVNADGFITPLNYTNLSEFRQNPAAVWKFRAHAGDERSVDVVMTAAMVPGENTTVLRFRALPVANGGKTVPVSVTIRADIEDRNFHWETQRNDGAEHHFARHSRAMEDRTGFIFTPTPDRQLRVFSSVGKYYPGVEWSLGIPHPVETTRGQTGAGDAFSPGWFDLPLSTDSEASLTLSAEPMDRALAAPTEFALEPESAAAGERFGQELERASRAFVVRRGREKTVIAGYPWFLDWGRDSLICARGLLAAGMVPEVTALLIAFGRFVENGTMPNTIHGDNASNRDTSDAALWYGVVCEEAAALAGESLYALRVDGKGRTIADVLREIAVGYARGTPNGIRMDSESALIWSPSHFTWMDTNYPAGTPREGYPIEIQALWIRLLRQLDRLKLSSDGISWGDLVARAERSLDRYWIEESGYFGDSLIASKGQPAATATLDNALRSNCLVPISLGLVNGVRARRCVEAAARYLVIPGAIRSLAPLPVSPPLAIHTPDGRLLNDPPNPYWGRYEGDEDTRRKPAYHNGTAWTWPFPGFCEALAVAWDFSPVAVAAAKAYLGSMNQLMNVGCVGQIPEITDGDAPHTQRGCDAQAWGATEALRVWKLLNPR